MNIEGKVFIISGGASGLGLGVAKAAMARGAKVGLFDTNDIAGKAITSEYAGSAVFSRVDVIDEVLVSAGIATVLDAFGKVDVCVNCAGIGVAGKTFGKRGPLPLQDFTRVIDVNLNGTFNVLRLAVAAMAKNEPDRETGERGVIVNTASGAAFDGQMGQAAYTASKAGIVGMTLPIARDLARMGIRINTIAPGPFETGMMAGLSDQLRQSLISITEFPKRLGNPSEFAALVLHLVENGFINGETIRIDAGGRLPPR